jgi:hypothetical protein
MIAHKLNDDGSLSHKAVLNDVHELNTWTWKNDFNLIQVESESTGVIRVFKKNLTGAYIEIDD